MNDNLVLRCSIIVSSLLVICIYFFYRSFSWPAGLESAECVIALVILISSFSFLWFFKAKPIVANHINDANLGLLIGLLWTVEIGINNLFHPLLPYRDIIDDTFWIVIAIIILVVAVLHAYKHKSIIAGIISGFWTGSSSGAIACLTALLLIVFGMQLILTDPLNMKEWTDVKTFVHSPGMDVYFAYQTLAGAIMHLVILGTIMGLILGLLGGVLGKFLASLKRQY